MVGPDTCADVADMDGDARTEVEAAEDGENKLVTAAMADAAPADDGWVFVVTAELAYRWRLRNNCSCCWA